MGCCETKAKKREELDDAKELKEIDMAKKVETKKGEEIDGAEANKGLMKDIPDGAEADKGLMKDIPDLEKAKEILSIKRTSSLRRQDGTIGEELTDQDMSEEITSMGFTTNKDKQSVSEDFSTSDVLKR